MTMYAISYGAGVQSTALLVLAAEGIIPHRLALFANVGADSENPQTLDYLETHAKPYAARHGIDLAELHKMTRDGASVTLYGRLLTSERSIDIPMRMANGAPGNRNCTETFKINVIKAELKRRGASKNAPAELAMGISLDEYQRMRSGSGVPFYTLAYPLIERRMDRAACMALIERAGLPVPPKSSCTFCPFQRIAQWKRLMKEQPDRFAQAVDLEARMNDRRDTLGKDHVYLTSAGKPLAEAVTDDGQLSMFDDGGSCDIAGYCHA
jgi:hypothetical protein